MSRQRCIRRGNGMAFSMAKVTVNKTNLYLQQLKCLSKRRNGGEVFNCTTLELGNTIEFLTFEFERPIISQ